MARSISSANARRLLYEPLYVVDPRTGDCVEISMPIKFWQIRSVRVTVIFGGFADQGCCSTVNSHSHGADLSSDIANLQCGFGHSADTRSFLMAFRWAKSLK